MEEYSFRHNLIGHLNLIDFVSPSDKQIQDKSENIKNNVYQTLNGKEASEFYNNVISMPSSTKDDSKLANKVHNEPKQKVAKSKIANALYCNSLFYFAQEGDVDSIKYCLIKGLDKDEQDAYGWTPLMCAVCAGHYNVVEYLIKENANISLKNKQNQTALDIALNQNVNPVIVKLLQTGKVPFTSSNTLKYKPQKKYCKKFCSACEIVYTEPTINHERSIPHLFSTKDAKDTSYYHIPENNKGFQMLLRSGWDKKRGLGPNLNGRKFPIKSILKKDRSGIGKVKESYRVTHFGPYDTKAVKGKIVPKEKTLKKKEREQIENKNRQKEINFRREFYCND